MKGKMNKGSYKGASVLQYANAVDGCSKTSSKGGSYKKASYGKSSKGKMKY